MEAMSIIGTCKLCKKSGVKLCDSHLIPKGAYRLIAKSQAGDAPIVMNSAIAISKNEQVHDYVFCKDCEDLFSKKGEKWVLKRCYRGTDGFALKTDLDMTVPVFEKENQLKVYSAKSAPSIDVSKLAYFAASIFWRSSIHSWELGGKRLNLPALGKMYEEQFRQYLLGYEKFPQDATLWLNIVNDNNLWSLISFPYGEKTKNYWQWQFQLLGLVFMLFIGARVPKENRQFCLANSADPCITVCKAADDMVLTHAAKLRAKSKPVGSLKA
jgi:hypothetical protein